MTDPAYALVAEMHKAVEQLRVDVEHIERAAAHGAGLHAQELAQAWAWKNLVRLSIGFALVLLTGLAAGFLLYPAIMLTCVNTVCYVYR